MFGVTPGIFYNYEAANLCSKGYAIEENDKWTVITKLVERKRIYKPCRVSDYDYDVKSNGWVIAG